MHQFERGVVGPVQVVQHADDRRFVGKCVQHLRHGFVEPSSPRPALGRRDLELRVLLDQLWQKASQLGQPDVVDSRESRGSDRLSHHIYERAEQQPVFELVTLALEDPPALELGNPQKLLDQPRLADARIADYKHNLPLTRYHRLPLLEQDSVLRTAT